MTEMAFLFGSGALKLVENRHGNNRQIRSESCDVGKCSKMCKEKSYALLNSSMLGLSVLKRRMAAELVAFSPSACSAMTSGHIVRCAARRRRDGISWSRIVCLIQ